MKFFDVEKLEFDIVSYEYAIRLWTAVLEISVLMAQFPSKEVAQLSYDYRTLGLGYANLGALLMVSGIPYDSPKANAICGALTSILTGQSYATSAEMAAVKGPFKMFEKNKKHMMRVMRNHRYAAYNTPLAYEGLSIPAVGIDPQHCPEDLLRSACNAWDKALMLGEKFGYRNAQSTVIAPTGTIGLVMDCDTTGIEPDFALVKFKKLSGGGYFKIINQAVPAALKTLGYTAEESQEIINYAKGHATLVNAPFINHETLAAKGFTAQDITLIESQLERAFDIDFVFNLFTLGEDMLKRLGFTEAQYNDSNFNLLKALGFKGSEIEAANEFVTGTMTIEGAPFLKEEHYPVFDTANKCGNKGTRFLHAHSHIRMMAAAQPFISGAISKTINLPNEATVEDIKSCYELSWKLGIKANALYRDGCKLSQPLSNKSDKKTDVEETVSDTVEMVEKAVGVSPSTRVEDLTPEIVLEAARLIINSSNNAAFKQQLSNIATRKILPNKRKGFTQKSKIDGNTIFVRTGEYEDGTLGEIFVDMHKEGASFRSLMNCFAIAVSIGLQYGVPLEEYYDKFTFSRFEPSGMVEGHANIKSSTSVVDFIFRLLGFEYLNRQEQLHIKPKIADEISPVDASFNLAQNEIQPTLVTETSSVGAPKAVKKPANLPPSMGDAPACKSCGNITVRSGTCYTCLTCGTTSGCS
jgi:ribonucleoside-diphosphate reductase alpha chain